MTMAVFIMLGIYVAMIITSPIIVILHELGHAFAYLLLTKPDRIDVFIGSYGDTDTRIKFAFSKIHFYVKLKFPYINTGGMCQSYKNESHYIKRIIILLAGPLFSFFIAIITGSIAFNTEVHGSVKLFCFALIILSFISLVNNLKPGTIPGADIDSDGRQLAFVMRARKLYANYISGLTCLDNGELDTSIAEFLKVYTRVPKNERVLRGLSTAYMLMGNYAEAEKYLYGLKKLSALKLADYLNRAYMFSKTNRLDLAIADYKRVLRRDPSNVAALNNLGYHLSMQHEYDEAQSLLQKAVKLAPQFAFAQNNLGYVKIMTGWVNQGKELIEKSLQLDPDNAHAYKNLGIYYLKAGNKQMALSNLNKAVELDIEVEADTLIAEAQLL